MLEYFLSLLQKAFTCIEELSFVSFPHYINYLSQQLLCSCVNRLYFIWQDRNSFLISRQG